MRNVFSCIDPVIERCVAYEQDGRLQEPRQVWDTIGDAFLGYEAPTKGEFIAIAALALLALRLFPEEPEE
jgi:hypothetical protein